MAEATTRPMLIGQLAAELGVNPKTVRYYEEIGVLPPPQRSPSGYRVYSAADRERLRFVLRARAVGLSLDEVRRVMTLRQGGQPPCGYVIELLEQKLAAVDQQIQALLEFRSELAALRQQAAEAMGADASICGIIEQGSPLRRQEHGRRFYRADAAAAP